MTISAQTEEFGRKSVFEGTYPRFLSFRGENNKVANSGYEAWCAALEGTSGFIKKFIPEEVPIAARTPEWANRHVARHPEQLALLHLNGEARQLCEFPEVRDRYFPGHWVYMPGTVLIQDCKAGDTELKVKNVKVLKQRGYIVRKNNPPTFLPQMVILVRLGEKGEKLWYESEFAEIRNLDPETGSVSLNRGVYGTEALNFQAGKTYVAPIAGGLWGKHVMFYYNLSSTCPEDKEGRKANEVYADEIASWFRKDGLLRNFDGIAFDVNYFDVSERGAIWDVDNDGHADGGWIGGRNVWKEGDIAFFAALRGKLGDDYLISADGQHWDNQQLPTLLNGIESEGLVQHNDMWRGFSRAMNTHGYWRAHGTRTPDFRYVVMKLMGKDVQQALSARRFGSACAACLGAAITVPVGDDKGKCRGFDFLPEAFSEEGSLGAPVGELVRYFRSVPAQPLLNGKEVRLAQDCCRTYKDGEVPELEFTLKNVTLPAGDLVFTVKAAVLEHDFGQAAAYQIPATLWLEPQQLPRYDKNRMYDSYFKDLYGWFGAGEGDEMTFYFRNMEAGTQDLKFRIRGARAAVLHEVMVYPAPDVILRRFEKAVIVANPSMKPVTLKLSDHLPGAPATVVTVPPVDAVYVKSE